MICPYCGRKLKDSSKYCTKCGSDVTKTEPRHSETGKEKRSAGRNAAGTGRKKTVNPPKRNNNSGILLAVKIIVPIALAIIAASIVIIAMHYHSEKQSEKTVSVAVSSEKVRGKAEATVKPEKTKEAETTVKPEKTKEAETTVKPEKTEEPAPSAEPALTETDDKSEEENNTPVPGVTETPEAAELHDKTEASSEKTAAETDAEPAAVTEPAEDPGFADETWLLPVDVSADVHSEASEESEVMFSYDPEPHRDMGSQLFYRGEAVKSRDSEGNYAVWLKVSMQAVLNEVDYGWVRADQVRPAVEGDGPYRIYLDGDSDYYNREYTAADQSLGVNVRSLPQHESDLVASPAGDTVFCFYGVTGRGYGSDGQMHDWYYVEWSDPEIGMELAGWVRSDLVRKVNV